MGKVKVKCDYCLDTGKYFGWLNGYVIFDCPCGQPDNPIKSIKDSRWKEFKKRWAK